MKSGHPNVALTYNSVWRGTTKNWQLVFNHSGASFTATSDMIAFGQNCHNTIFRQFIASSGTFFAGFKYYNGIDSAALYEIAFANQAAATAAGWLAPTADVYSSAIGNTSTETCVVLEAPVGTSSTGKPVVMRKYIHGVPGGVSADQPEFNNTGTTPNSLAVQLGNGALYGSRVLCTKSGAQGTWSTYPYYANRQMYRRRKKKGTTTVSSSFLGDVASLALKLAESAASDL